MMKLLQGVACVCLQTHLVAAQFDLLGQVLPLKRSDLRKRAECGPGVGSCDPGMCCSEGGWCGTTEEYCIGSGCQLEYSDSCDTFFGPPGSSTEDISRPKIGNVPYGTIITDCVESGKMALTFDDGPWIYTTEMLDNLEDLGVTATFFIAGNNIGKGEIDDDSTGWPAILRRMYDAGHQLASHIWTHRNLDEVSTDIIRSEIIYNEMAFRDVFGFFPTYIRPPYLACSAGEGGCLDVLGGLGYHVINVNVDTKDYMYDDPSLIQNAKDRFDSGVSLNSADHDYIVLAHDVHYQTVTNLTFYMVETARERGYELVTVGECLGDPRENWYRDAGNSARSCTSTSSTEPMQTRASSTSPYPTPSQTLGPSEDQTCGGDTGYTCAGSAFGHCCSFWGFCGSSPEYCGTGCDNNFGFCDPRGSDIQDTTNGLCGNNWGATCLNYGEETCCSEFGYCGNSSEHCGTGCQAGFGDCD